MNDLRSQNRTLAPVREIGPQTGEIVNNPSGRRSPSKGNPLFEDSRAGRRSAVDKLAELGFTDTTAATSDNGTSSHNGNGAGDHDHVDDETDHEALTFPVSRQLDSMPVSAREERRRPSGRSGERADAVDNEASADESAQDPGVGARSRTRRRRDLAATNDGPDTRPAKRREAPEDDPEPEVEEEKFSWSFKFDEDEEQPEELQAKSPLLSRAFRSSVG